MAQVTPWLKRIGRPPRWQKVMLKAVYTLHDTWELWLTDPENRVLRCALEPKEVRALLELGFYQFA
jgi:hypothetical protein